MNNTKRATLIVIIFVFIAVSLVLIAPLLTNKYTYKGPSGNEFNFIKSQTGEVKMHLLTAYATYKDKKTNQYTIPLRNGPKDLEKIDVQKDINNLILNKEYVYITMSPEYTGKSVIAGIEIAKVLGTASYSVFKISTEGALTFPANNTNVTGTPIINCKDANKELGVILLNLGKENKIYSNKECVILEAKDEDSLIKVADRFVYNLLGVM